MTYNSSFVSHLIRANLFFEQSRNLKKWYKMFVYHMTKNFFFDKMISIKVSPNSKTKNFSAQKTPKGAFKFFWVHHKKKNYLPKLIDIKK